MGITFDAVIKPCLDQLRKIDKAEQKAVIQGIRRAAWNIKRKMLTSMTKNKSILSSGGWGKFSDFAAFSKDVMDFYDKKPGGAIGKSPKVWVAGRTWDGREPQAVVGYPKGVKKFAEAWQTPGYRIDAMKAALWQMHIANKTGRVLELYSTMDRNMIRRAFAEARDKGLLERLHYNHGAPSEQPARPKREIIGDALYRYADKAVVHEIDKCMRAFL